MAQRPRQNKKKDKPKGRAPRVLAPLEVYKPKNTVPTQYGKPFILLEDTDKNTFEYQGGAWVPHAKTIAECQVDCQVKELSQKVNKMTRYEVRSPVTADV